MDGWKETQERGRVAAEWEGNWFVLSLDEGDCFHSKIKRGGSRNKMIPLSQTQSAKHPIVRWALTVA